MQEDIGKLGAQYGHAFTKSLKNYIALNPDCISSDFEDAHGGSKVCLVAKNARQLTKALAHARRLGLPCALVVDQEHVLPPHFTGEPIITAIGIGPCTKAEAREVVKKFQCLKRNKTL